MRPNIKSTTISTTSKPLLKLDVDQNFYIYSYVTDNGDTYYIGKGKNNRAWDKHTNVDTPKDDKNIIILESNISETSALILEEFYIKHLGRVINGTGILHNKLSTGLKHKHLNHLHYNLRFIDNFVDTTVDTSINTTIESVPEIISIQDVNQNTVLHSINKRYNRLSEEDIIVVDKIRKAFTDTSVDTIKSELFLSAKYIIKSIPNKNIFVTMSGMNKFCKENGYTIKYFCSLAEHI
jgi:hypothetical protein